ncbi:MAG: hypothetical protein QNJ75_06305 [Acidimicrobiia bacterium]|nr:hypothetical protein [Acidimicrobiia bacterium]
MGDWLLGSLITTVVVGLGWFFFTQVLPRRVADRTARPPEQPLTQLPGVEDQPVVQIDAEAALSSSKMTHDVFLSEADDLILQARVAGLFADNLLAEAAEKANDAVKLRPGSFAANLMVGEIAMKRAMLADTPAAISLLEQAAVSFATASEAKKGVIDTYVGRAWAHLERAHRLEAEQAAAAYLDASEVFLKGFRVSPQNLFILRGWGIAIDGLARTVGDRAEPVLAAEEGYRLALAEHRGGDHELHEWYAGVRAADEPVRIPMPPVRDRF